VLARRIATLLALAVAAGTSAHVPHEARPESLPAMLAQYGALPLRFERAAPDDGTNVYVARARGYAIAVSRDGIDIAAAGAAPVGMRFVDASEGARLEGVASSSTAVYRLRGSNVQNASAVTGYERIAIAGLHPGLDIVLHGNGQVLEYDVLVAPGADPSRLGLRIEGAARVDLDGSGNLTIATGAGTFSLERPHAYQSQDGARTVVESGFVVDDAGIVRIRVGSYDHARPLVIDPVVSYATYIGGNNYEQATAVAVDGAGNVYVTGYTASTDFPLLNPYDRSIGRKGDVEVFVSKLNASGAGLVWSTYVGGASADRAVGIALDAAGNVYITGTTSGADFPVSTNGWQKGIAGGGGFVAKLAPAGNALVYSTYIASANPSSVAVDSAGNAYVAGSAASTFVTTANALQRTNGSTNGSATGFVVKLDAAGTAPLFSTFLGGSGGEDATSIALDEQGNAYVGGWTTSNDFPVRNAFQAVRRGGKEGFVAKLASDGSQLLYSTLLGGALDDAVNAIAVGPLGNAYVAGETYSSDFPVQEGFQMKKSGFRLVNSSVGNAFVAKLGPAGDALVYSSFAGGEVCETACETLFPIPQYRADAAYGIALDADGHAYVVGIARSYTFPLVDSASLRKQQDNQDSAFAMKVAISGGRLLWSTFLRTGYGEADNLWTRVPPGAASAVAVDASGAAYVAGDADSASNFQPTPGAFQTTSTYGPAAIVAKFKPAPAMTLTTSNPTVDAQTPITLTAALPGFAGSGTVTFMDGAAWIGSANVTSSQASVMVTLAAGIHMLSAIMLVSGSNADAAPLTQVVDVPLVCR
jgi:hypothetical protein